MIRAEDMKFFGDPFASIKEQESARISESKRNKSSCEAQLGACEAILQLGRSQAFNKFLEKVQELERQAIDGMVAEMDPNRSATYRGMVLCYRQILAILSSASELKRHLEGRLQQENTFLEKHVVRTQDGSERVAPGGV